jgi:hypothetical protein
MSKVTVEVIENPVAVVVESNNVSVSVTEQVAIIELGTSGPQGPKGDPGEVLYSDLSYVHNQASAASVWTINHNLQFIPNITVVDSSGTVVEGSYNYPDENTVVLTFSSAFAGKAYLS